MTNYPDLPSSELIKSALLDALLYEDDQWLWEPVWGLNSTHPGVTVEAKVAVVRVVVQELLDEGLVSLYLSPGWPTEGVLPLTSAEIATLAGDSAVWSDPTTAAMLVQIKLTNRNDAELFVVR